ncbi:ABC transporter permease [Salinibacterium sp. dk2585]|uniref:ABC transporter permease n=1 Tax=unclassified Salinibacterium TaxID=2632331 RepID=UPI0011C245E6|nr:ABC transporter permease [Salinibacterium sp. dk2585]TXK54710.1 ABC transporter permease [Salinibacterium sp. dk5596]
MTVAASPPGGPARRVPWTQHSLAAPVLGVVGIILFLAVWEVASRTGLVNPRFFPPASDVLVRLGTDLVSASFWTSVGQTMTSWVIGLAISAVAATVIGFVIGGSNFLRKATHTTIEFLRPIPSVALIPLAVLLFGVSIESALLLIVYASFWQILIQVLYGTADVDSVAMDTARSYGLGWWARVRHVVWPTTLPYLITGLRLAAAVALVLAITAELVIGTPGIGKQIELNRSGGSVVAMYSLVLATGIIGVIINMVMRFIEKRVLRWHASVRKDVAV